MPDNKEWMTLTSEMDELVAEWLSLSGNITKKDMQTQCFSRILILADRYKWMTSKNNPTVMTAKETEIIKMICSGMSTKEIASDKFISQHTVESHRANIYSKLHINKVSELIIWAFKNGLIVN